jgi:hypothetical protein
MSRDVDAVEVWNQQLGGDGLYLSHLFTEDQVILRPDGRSHRVAVGGDWQRLRRSRLGDVDLRLSRLMPDDPLDQNDAEFILARAGLTAADVREAMAQARVPAIAEVQEQFQIASAKLLRRIT